MMNSARKIFPTRTVSERSWFDEECSRARAQVSGRPTGVEFREYRNLIRAKKRAFLRQHQKLLTEELKRDPRVFWSRLKGRKKKIDALPADILALYVQKLYFFPEAQAMAAPSGPVCVFTVEEVETEGCPLSPSLFGLVIDNLFWQSVDSDVGIQLGEAIIRMMLFADDVALLASSQEQMNRQIDILTRFCDATGMSVNLTKTRWMRIGKKAQETFFFKGVEIEECRIYKYLGVEFAANLSWTKCIKSRGAVSRDTKFKGESLLGKGRDLLAVEWVKWTSNRNTSLSG
ncbi:hypothetical protein R1sor_001101 [Riccia sorocarpa]|uniref:Reverse transcriptase domain-containing protein n=1 Tax=Riccia sorocarpa TaxID=122646 RepID=A0ABD3GYZ3_9MARC